jgi:serine/threonine-protein kinase
MNKIGRYKILKRLGEGGFGEVFLALDPTIEREVAIKIFRPKDENLIAFATSSVDEGLTILRARFLQEAKILAGLEEATHVVGVLEFGELEDGAPWYAMPYVPDNLSNHLGSDIFDKRAIAELDEAKRPKALPLDQALNWLHQIIDGLASAHENQLVHRDIKPANILLTNKGIVRIADFGIAKMPDGQQSTVSHLGMGSRNYMAPEQRESAKHVDARADVYSLGRLAYRMITGVLPTGRFVDPNVVQPALSQAVNDVIIKAITEDSDGRYKNCQELKSVFEKVLKEGSSISDENATSATMVEGPSAKLRDEIVPLKNRLKELLLAHGEIPASAQMEIEALSAIADVSESDILELTRQLSQQHKTVIVPKRNFVKHLEAKAASNPEGLGKGVRAALINAGTTAGFSQQEVTAKLEELLPTADNESAEEPVPKNVAHLPIDVTQQSFDTAATTGGQANSNDIVSTQRILKRLGYQVAESGRLDVRTQQAIKEFEEAQNLKQTGDVDPLLQQALQQEFTKQDKQVWDEALKSKQAKSLKAYAKAWPDGAYVNQVDKTLEQWVWRAATQKNTIQAYQYYLKEYANGLHRTQAVAAEDEAAWVAACEKNSKEAYQIYANNYPQGTHIGDVETAQAKVVWGLAQQENTLKSYQQYLDNNPQGQYRDHAEIGLAELKTQAARKALYKKIIAVTVTFAIAVSGSWWQITADDRAWEHAKTQNNRQTYQQFITDWYSSDYARQAQQRLDKLEDSYWQSQQKVLLGEQGILSHNSNLGLLEDYTKSYPNGRYSKQVKQQQAEVEKLSWEYASEQNNVDLLVSYKTTFPQGKHTAAADAQLGKIDDIAWQKAININTKKAYVQYQRSFSQGQYSDQVATKIKAITDEANAKAKAKAEAQKNLLANKQRLEKELVALNRYVGKLVKIPSGTFQMGSNEASDEKPIHRTSVASFHMQEHEVTWAQYQSCIDAGACSAASDQGYGKGSKPVINISWNDITKKYIPWLNKQTGMRFRLPTEAEWEYAARAKSNTKYTWGNAIRCSQARYGVFRGICGNARETIAVKSYAPNSFGLYDMHGNVREWVQDCYHDSYSGAPNNGSARTSCNSKFHVLRGGAFINEADNLRSADRSNNTADGQNYASGFRLAHDL